MRDDLPADPGGASLLQRRRLLGLAALCLGPTGAAMSQTVSTANAPTPAAAPATFTNPVLPGQEAGDPWVVFHEGAYYLTATFDPEGGLWIYRSTHLSDWRHAEKRKVWNAEPSGPRSAMIWAPELHRLNGKWYLYFTASDKVDANHRHYVLEADHPMGPFRDLGRVHAAHERYSIDGSVLKLADGKLYWMYADDGLWIAPMSSPSRADGPGVRIAVGEHDWERSWHKREGRWEPQANNFWIEAPQALQHGGRTFVVYSAGHTAAVYYLGLLELVGKDPMLPSSWRKTPKPVFGPHEGPDGGVYAPGHCSFTKSPDGKEDWIVYHAKDVYENDATGRTMRVQRFDWSADGAPVFGEAMPAGKALKRPSGER
ncbi:MAG: glycoside hydrolase family 43 protein [Burkholderiaceae bacterium]